MSDAITSPSRPPLPEALLHASRQKSDQNGEEQKRPSSGDFNEGTATDIRRRSYSMSSHPRPIKSGSPKMDTSSPTHAKPKPSRPPPPSKGSIRTRPSRPPPPAKRANSLPRGLNASSSLSKARAKKPYSKSSDNMDNIPDKEQDKDTRSESSKSSEAECSPSPMIEMKKTIAAVTVEVMSQSHSNSADSLGSGSQTQSANDSTDTGEPVMNQDPLPDQTNILTPQKTDENEATTVLNEMSPVVDSNDPPIKPPRLKKSVKLHSPSQSPKLATRQHSPKPTSANGTSLTETATDSSPKNSPERVQNEDATKPVIPPRPYRPPRPFPPPSKRNEGATRPQANGHSEVDTEGSHDKIPEPPNLLSGSYDKLETKEVKGHSEGSKDGNLATAGQALYKPKVLFDAGEAEDEVPPLQASPKSRGRKLLNSMKKSLRHFRHHGEEGRRHTEKGREGEKLHPPLDLKRSLSDSALNVKAEGTNIDTDAETPCYPDPLPQGIIHPLVVQCVAYLNRDSVLHETGLFRIPGDIAVIRKLRSEFIRGTEVDLCTILDPHTVTGLMKVHFREQRVSLIPRGQPLADIIQAVKARDVETVRRTLNGIDVSQIATLRIVAEVLNKVVEYSQYNQMTSGTLATSCGPSILPYLPPSNANSVLKFLIDHCSDLF